MFSKSDRSDKVKSANCCGKGPEISDLLGQEMAYGF